MSDLRRIARTALTEHRCPGACARMVPNRLFACDPCWKRLPREIRRALIRKRSGGPNGRDRFPVEDAARQWFLDNPPPAPIPGPP